VSHGEGRKALQDAHRSFQRNQGAATEEVVAAIAKAAQLTGHSQQFVLQSVKAAWQRRQF
jgi:hypothetical protein